MTSISGTRLESEMFWLKSITAAVQWSNESGRVSCLYMSLISLQRRTEACVCVQQLVDRIRTV